jgi:hypothetical protein
MDRDIAAGLGCGLGGDVGHGGLCGWGWFYRRLCLVVKKYFLII